MVCRRWPGAGRRRLGGTSRSLSKRAVAGAGRGLSRARVGHSSDTRVAKSAYSPEITGLHEWARGELNHLTAARNPRKDWPVATCPRNDGQSRGTTRYVEVPRRHRVGHVPPEFNPTLASSALGPGELRDSRP